MSHLNTNALISMLQNTVRADNGPTAATFKTVYVENSRFSITILNMVFICDDAWKKRFSLESLASSVRGKMDVHSSLDLVTVIPSQLPNDVTIAYMESKVARQEIMSIMTKVENLTVFFF